MRTKTRGRRSRERRQVVATSLLLQRASRSAADQIQLLDARFGIRQGATRERARLGSVVPVVTPKRSRWERQALASTR